MTFTDQFKTFQWDDIGLQVQGKTAQDVENALNASRLSIQDFMALISPAGDLYLESMAQKSQQLTRQRFGNTIQLYIPLYLSNKCHNICTYCGFSLENHIKRTTLSEKQILEEIVAIKNMGFEHVLLLTGEAPGTVGMTYFRKVFPLFEKHFSHVSIEIQPLDKSDYSELIGLGVDAVMVYQETYNPISYANYHLRGNKQDFYYRLETADRLGKAGMKKIVILITMT